MKLKYQIIRYIAAFVLVVMIGEWFAPSLAYALTTGPSQPEAQAFTPVGTSQMVDPFTGNFSYSIPLLELPGPNGGYPLVLGYNAGITMDQEASWVGLGWNLSPGMINRQMRGFPDEFKGDEVETQQDIRPNVTVGLNFSTSGVQGVEIFGADLGVGITGGGNLGIHYNSYNGLGYTYGPNLGLSADGGDGHTAAIGIGTSLDPNEGIGVSPSLSLGYSHNRVNAGFRTGFSFNSRRGITDVSLGGTFSKDAASILKVRKNGESNWKTKGSMAMGGTSTFSFANTAYSPQIQLPMKGRNFSFNAKFGADPFNGIFANLPMSGYVNTSSLAQKEKSEKAYGYLHLEDADSLSLQDFNREKDGMLHENTRYLGTAMGTHDVFTIAGQGAGGMFRAYRNQVGVFSNPIVKSNSAGIMAGFEAGVPGHGGFNVGTNWSFSKSGPWEAREENGNQTNEIDPAYGFSQSGDAQDYEPYYFKSHGEPTTQPLTSLDYIGEETPMEVEMEKYGFVNKKYKALDKLTNERGGSITPTTDGFDSDPDTRKTRNKVVTSFTNADLGTASQLSSNDLSLDYMEVGYFNSLSDLTDTTVALEELDRSAWPEHHLGGFVNTEANGAKYVYGLPAYNHKQVECQFSVDDNDVSTTCGPLIDVEDSDGLPDYKVPGTDNYLNRQEVPEYPYAWMLTAVLGTDYVDADSIPGPSDGDFGYWVKFNYIKTDENQGWRAPFGGANYSPGAETDRADDKGSYMYGTKEIYYLASAETRTHIAEFALLERYDAKGAAKEIQNGDSTSHLSGSSYKLDKISLFSKEERINENGNRNAQAVPIQVAHFDYDYSLCKGLPNNIQTLNGVPAQSGKLTLKKVWFTYESNDRGALSPYEFDYHANNLSENPDYHTHKNNRWGEYLPFDQVCDNLQYPYVDPYAERDSLDKYAGVWSLKEVSLPSGASMAIDYEADDYAYVQNKRAMNMVEITGVDGASGDFTLPNEKDPSLDERKVYFNLIDPIPRGQAELIHEYDDGSGQLYFNLNINLLDPGKNFYDPVRGYAEVIEYGLDSITGTNFTEGWVRLAFPEVNNRTIKYHPFCHAAWQHVRTNRPKLIGGSSFAYNGSQSNGMQGLIQQIQTLNPVNMANQISQTFIGFYKFSSLANWGKEIDSDRAWIRVQNPNKRKVGGGHRVKSITMSDNWGDDTGNSAQTQEVGTVYEYTTIEDGIEVSSGVAQYEPMIGGDENPFRLADKFADGVRVRTQNNLYFEHPVNEQYMPGPVVGYGKVTVKSLTTQQVIEGQLGSHVPTTGAVVNEFYTARDYPVQVDHTNMEVIPRGNNIPIPLIGMISYTGRFASQGFSIKLNDMHGKPKAVSNYRQDSNGQLDLHPISWVKYHYRDETRFPGTEKAYRLLNSQVKTVLYDVDPADLTQAETEDRLLGVEHEFFLDMRESSSNSGSFGINANAEVIPPVVIPPVWPSLNDNITLVRTASTNKIIHQTGIVEQIEAYNEGSLVKTDNLLWDAQTGQVLLSSVTNDYDDPVYSYSYPAHWAYDRMGPAYQNIGLEFSASNIGSDIGGEVYPATLNSFAGGAHPDSLLAPGDEFVVNKGGGTDIEHAIYVGKNGSGDYLFFAQNSIKNLSATTDFKLVRSGRRNHLDVNVQQITALKDPTKDRLRVDCMRDLANPGQLQDSLKLIIEPEECVENYFSMLNELFPLVDDYTGLPVGEPPYNAYDLCWTQPYLNIDRDNDNIWLAPDEGPNCNTYLYDDQGQQIDITTIDDFVEYFVVLTYPGPTVSGYEYTQYKIEYTDDNSTTQFAYAFTDYNSPCDWPQNRYYINVEVPGAEPGPDTLTTTLYRIDSVLSATAATFSEAWPQDYNAVYNPSVSKTQLEGWHPYASGEMGIWRLQKSYLYTDQRRQSAPLNTRKDGTLLDVPIFDHNSLIFDYCSGSWVLENEVTAYSPYSFELENRDVQGIHSSALYAYRGQWPIAVAGNAKQYEIAFEGFEEYTAGGTISPEEMTSSNLDLYNTYSGPYTELPAIHKTYDVLFGSGTSVTYDGGTPGNTGSAEAKVQARSEGSIWNLAEQYGGIRTLTNDSPLNTEPYFHLKSSGQYWRGRIGLPFPWLAYAPGNYSTLNSTNVALSDSKAHTGKRSVKLTGTFGFPQNRLLPEEGKQYALQLWVSRDADTVPTFKSALLDPAAHVGISIDFLDVSNNLISSSNLMEPAGPLVEGWQKIEGGFWVPSGTKRIRMVYQSGQDENQTDLVTYFDDIRLQPYQSSMKTYVYDTGDWRLQAVLDDDNFATLYRYDEAGNLVVILKETYDGLRAIQESRAFVQEL